MKIKTWMLAAALTLSTMAHAATNDLTGLLQQGLFEEEANRNLDAAIANYQTLATAFDKDRQLAATAIFRLGECYRKLGKTNEAVVQYQRIVKEFSDQQSLVTLSRQNLAGLNAISPPPVTDIDQSAIAKNEADIAQLDAQLHEIKAMPRSEARIFVQQNYPNPVLTTYVQELDLAQQKLIELKTDYTPDHPKYKSAKELVDDLNSKIDAQVEGVLTGLRQKLSVAEAQLRLLQARQQEFSSTSGGGSSGTSESATTDEEQTQIRNIQAMIQNSPDLINAPIAIENGYRTPLELAAEKGQLIVAKYLLDHGAAVDGAVRNGASTALYLATANGHKAMVELLLAHGADVNGARGPSPLDPAVSKGFTGVVDVLLANKADVNAYGGGDGKRVLHEAVLNNKTNLIQLLIEHGADVNATDSSSNTPLHFAASQGELDAAKILLAAKATVDPQNKAGNTPLHNASTQGSEKVVSLLLDSGASVDATNRNLATPLIFAVLNLRANAVRVLLAHKANPNLNSRQESNWSLSPPIGYAIGRREPEVVQMILEAGANPNGDTNTPYRPIFSALNKNQVDELKLLLQHGADSNARDNQGFTPLFRTTEPEIGRLLAEHKADLNARDKNGQTPLIYAANSTAPTDDFINFLVEAGAKTDLQDTNGNTALHYAVFNLKPEPVAILLEHKANPNVQNDEGFTPLDLAKGGNSRGSMLSERSPTRRVALPVNEFTIPTADSRLNNTSPLSDVEQKIVDLLVNAGGLANLPKRDRIEIRRSSYGGIPFTKGSRNWNQVSLLESIAAAYGLLIQKTSGEWRVTTDTRQSSFNLNLRFPDFRKVVVYRRTTDSAKQTPMNVDVESILNSGDCSRDIGLEWGDIVEIPEADHPVDEQWPGLSDADTTSMSKCLARQVTVKIKGESTVLKLSPDFTPANKTPGDSMRTLVHTSFMLRSVLDNSKLVRVSSDLSRVKVTRQDPLTKKTLEWTIDCTNPDNDNLWLRDGDVIEVPEK